jgi:hypothetical protein
LREGSEQNLFAALQAGAGDCMPSLRQFELLAQPETLTVLVL